MTRRGHEPRSHQHPKDNESQANRNKDGPSNLDGAVIPNPQSRVGLFPLGKCQAADNQAERGAELEVLSDAYRQATRRFPYQVGVVARFIPAEECSPLRRVLYRRSNGDHVSSQLPSVLLSRQKREEPL